MPPFIATLAMMSIARGIALMLTSGRPIFNLPESFSFLGGGFFWDIPIPIIIMLIIYLFAHISLTYTKSGLYFYAIGGNEEAARVTGIKSNVVKMRAYLISGFCAAIAGIVLLAMYYLAHPPFGGAVSGPGNFWIVNYNLIEIAALLVCYYFPTNRHFGLDALRARQRA